MPDADYIVPNFHGDFVYSIDQSRRVMVPASWRPADKKIVFRAILWPIGVVQNLLVLPPERWKVMLDKLKTKSLLDKGVAALERQVGATSAELVMDQVGRFCLPENLAVGAGLVREAQFVGRLDKFEIWNPERYQASEAADRALAAELAEKIDL